MRGPDAKRECILLKEVVPDRIDRHLRGDRCVLCAKLVSDSHDFASQACSQAPVFDQFGNSPRLLSQDAVSKADDATVRRNELGVTQRRRLNGLDCRRRHGGCVRRGTPGHDEVHKHVV